MNSLDHLKRISEITTTPEPQYYTGKKFDLEWIKNSCNEKNTNEEKICFLRDIIDEFDNRTFNKTFSPAERIWIVDKIKRYKETMEKSKKCLK